MKRVGILTSGGDAPGMNACIRAAVRTALDNGLEVTGIRRGFSGLINGELCRLDRRAIRNIVHRGGTILETTRSPEFETQEGMARAYQTLDRSGIDALVLIGGEGTFRGAGVFEEEFDITLVGVPGTIDNDVYGTDYCIGFDTAINCALGAIDRIRDTASSHERLFFLEVMGHHSGFLALESGIAGGVEEILIPEYPLNIDDLSTRLQEYLKAGKSGTIVVVAEGNRPGISYQIASAVKKKVDMESRVCVLGHLQRGGSPTARDRILASTLGVAAIQAVLEGREGNMVGEVKGDLSYTCFKDTWQKKKPLPAGLTSILRLLSE